MIARIKQTTFYRWLRRNQTLYFIKNKLTDMDYKGQRKAMSCSLTKSKKQIKYEMELCRNYWHCNPTHYIRYGLFDKTLSDEEILDYIPRYYLDNFYRPRICEWSVMDFYNKKNSLSFIYQQKIPTPKVIALVKKGILEDLEGNAINLQVFCHTLKGDKKYFFKPINEQGGKGIQVFRTEIDKKHNLTKLSDFLKCLKKKCTYVIQEGIEQHRDFQIINASSINTLRVITQLNDEIPKLCACVLRMGRNGNDVDNSSQGGLSCRINENDGSFYPFAITVHGGELFPHHPDSGFVFEGKRVNNWKQIKSEVIRYARHFPELKEIGWDVAVTPSGIQIIEFNLGYDLDLLQCCCGGMRRMLNVYPKEV